MSGYSGTPLAKKLGIKAGSQLLLIDAPDDYIALLEPLPEGVQFNTQLSEATDIVQIFSVRQGRASTAARKLPHQAQINWNNLGVVAEEIRQGANRHHRRHHSRNRAAIGLCRYQGLRRRSGLVGSEARHSKGAALALKLRIEN